MVEKQVRLLAPQRGALPVFAPAPLTSATPCICTVSLVYPQAPGSLSFCHQAAHVCLYAGVYPRPRANRRLLGRAGILLESRRICRRSPAGLSSTTRKSSKLPRPLSGLQLASVSPWSSIECFVTISDTVIDQAQSFSKVTKTASWRQKNSASARPDQVIV